MTLSETDYELIEASLDGESAAVEAVAGRAAEPVFADAMAEAASARADRQAFWKSITPTQARAEQFAWQMRGQTAGHNRAVSGAPWSGAPWSGAPWSGAPWWKPGAIVRYGSVAAACIVFGFFAGRSGNTVQMQQNPSANPAAAAGVIVPISDEYGTFVGWQPFKSTEEAKQFETGMHHALPSTATPVPVQRVSDTTINGISF